MWGRFFLIPMMIGRDHGDPCRRDGEALLIFFAVVANHGALWDFIPLVDDAALEFAVLANPRTSHHDALLQRGVLVNVDKVAQDRSADLAAANDHARGQQ